MGHGIVVQNSSGKYHLDKLKKKSVHRETTLSNAIKRNSDFSGFTFHFFFHQFSSFEKAEEVEEFFSTRDKSGIDRTLKQSVERVHINARWVQSVQSENYIAEAVRELAHQI